MPDPVFSPLSIFGAFVRYSSSLSLFFFASVVVVTVVFDAPMADCSGPRFAWRVCIEKLDLEVPDFNYCRGALKDCCSLWEYVLYVEFKLFERIYNGKEIKYRKFKEFFLLCEASVVPNMVTVSWFFLTQKLLVGVKIEEAVSALIAKEKKICHL